MPSRSTMYNVFLWQKRSFSEKNIKADKLELVDASCIIYAFRTTCVDV